MSDYGKLREMRQRSKREGYLRRAERDSLLDIAEAAIDVHAASPEARKVALIRLQNALMALEGESDARTTG